MASTVSMKQGLVPLHVWILEGVAFVLHFLALFGPYYLVSYLDTYIFFSGKPSFHYYDGDEAKKIFGNDPEMYNRFKTSHVSIVIAFLGLLSYLIAFLLILRQSLLRTIETCGDRTQDAKHMEGFGSNTKCFENTDHSKGLTPGGLSSWVNKLRKIAIVSSASCAIVVALVQLYLWLHLPCGTYNTIQVGEQTHDLVLTRAWGNYFLVAFGSFRLLLACKYWRDIPTVIPPSSKVDGECTDEEYDSCSSCSTVELAAYSNDIQSVVLQVGECTEGQYSPCSTGEVVCSDDILVDGKYDSCSTDELACSEDVQPVVLPFKSAVNIHEAKRSNSSPS